MSESEKTVSLTSPAGALQSSLSVALHTHYAIRLWNGRKPDTESKKTRREIIGMPQVIARAGVATQDSLADNPYADWLLIRLEEMLRYSAAKMEAHLSELDKLLQAIPKGIRLSDVSSAEPLTVKVFSRSPLGYQCVWLLVGYDQLTMKAFQACHYGLLSRSQRDSLVGNGGHLVRKVYAVLQSYRPMLVTRHDLLLKTPQATEAIARYGELEPDILSGKKRSLYSPPLKLPLPSSE